MNIVKILKALTVILISLGLSLAISRSEVSYNASPCISNSVCEERALGTKTVKWLGFPAHFNIHTTFTPNENTQLDGLEHLGGDIQYSMILINTLFWIFAICGGVQIIHSLAKKKSR